MDRTAKIAVALAIVTLFGWTYYNQRETEKAAAIRRAAAAEEAQKSALEAPATPAPAPAPAAATPPVEAAPAQPQVPEKIETIRTPVTEYTFTNLGGGVAKVVLLKHEAEKGQRMVINEFGATPIGAVGEVAGEAVRLPYTTTLDPDGAAITFQRTDARQLEVAKRYSVASAGDAPAEYTLRLDLTFTNRAAEPVSLPAYFIHTGAAAPVHQSDLPMYIGFKHSGGKFTDVNWFAAGGFLGFGHGERPVYSETRPDLAWLGVTDQYFSTLLSPQVTAKDPAAQTRERGASVWARRFNISDEAWTAGGRLVAGNAPRHAVESALGMPGFTLPPGASTTQTFLIYTGPREYSRLKRIGSTEEEMMDFGMFGIVSKTLLNGLNWLHAHLGSYAFAIIVLTLIIKSLLWPMQNKATNSMKRMQLLQPKMVEIKEKYSDDPQRMNAETMKLYKDFGVNPLSGCLPMLIQIPIFFGFYNMLGKAVELRNSHFLWIKDLSQPDTLFHLGGIPVNPLPLVMAATMFWQMAISPKSGDPAQQRIFMFMPLIFVFFCYNYASALALYWAVQNLFSVAQLYATRNQAPPQLQKVAARPKKK